MPTRPNRRPASPAALKQMAYRTRLRRGEVRPYIAVSSLVRRALIEQAVHAGIPRYVAEAEVADRKKASALAARVLEDWARTYLRNT